MLPAHRSSRAYREQHAWKEEPSYEIACDFANAWKHRKVSRSGKVIDGIADVHEAYVRSRYFDEKGPYYCGHKVVVLKNSQGHEADLRRVLIAATRFWAVELHRLGLTPKTLESIFDYEEFVSRVEAESLGPLIVHGHVGEPMNLPARSFNFDPVTKKWVSVTAGTDFSCTIPITVVTHESPFSSNASQEAPAK